MKKIWFEGSNMINCKIQEIEGCIKNPGEFITGTVSLMPGITSLELAEEGSDFVIIKTNEGLMKRTNIKKSLEQTKLVIEFDEEYQAGRMITAKSHYFEEFTAAENGVIHRTVISDVTAKGLIAYFNKVFGSKNIGKAVLASNKEYLEKIKE